MKGKSVVAATVAAMLAQAASATVLNLGPTKVKSIIDAAIDIVLPRAVAKNIEITTEYDSEVDTITCDSSRLQQMVWNLLTNAVKFTPAGGHVNVRYERRGETIRIIVSDTGIGIAKEFLPYVFDRFRQQDSTSTRRHDGLGLGLAIVRHLAELHGGAMRIRSTQNVGTIVLVRLPVENGAMTGSADTLQLAALH